MPFDSGLPTPDASLTSVNVPSLLPSGRAEGHLLVSH